MCVHRTQPQLEDASRPFRDLIYIIPVTNKQPTWSALLREEGSCARIAATKCSSPDPHASTKGLCLHLNQILIISTPIYAKSIRLLLSMLHIVINSSIKEGRAGPFLQQRHISNPKSEVKPEICELAQKRPKLVEPAHLLIIDKIIQENRRRLTFAIKS